MEALLRRISETARASRRCLTGFSLLPAAISFGFLLRNKVLLAQACRARRL
jgi:hypothetical protein